MLFIRLEMLIDSLMLIEPSDRSSYERLLQRIAHAFGAMRASLTPDLRVTFDPKARTWLREQARQGYHVAIPGITLRP